MKSLILKFSKIGKIPKTLARLVLQKSGHLTCIDETQHTQTPVSFDMWWRHYIQAGGVGPYWPVHPSSEVTQWRNIVAGVETSPGYMPGCYIQGMGKVTIGDYTQIAANVGIISANHNLHDLREHIPTDVKIGRYSWIGMGAIILPGVTLGDFTIVAAGSVVTKSFPNGYCVIGGNPAKQLKTLDKEACLEHKSPHEYHGFIRAEDFPKFRKQYLEH